MIIVDSFGVCIILSCWWGLGYDCITLKKLTTKTRVSWVGHLSPSGGKTQVLEFRGEWIHFLLGYFRLNNYGL